MTNYRRSFQEICCTEDICKHLNSMLGQAHKILHLGYKWPSKMKIHSGKWTSKEAKSGMFNIAMHARRNCGTHACPMKMCVEAKGKALILKDQSHEASWVCGKRERLTGGLLSLQFPESGSRPSQLSKGKDNPPITVLLLNEAWYKQWPVGRPCWSDVL